MRAIILHENNADAEEESYTGVLARKLHMTDSRVRSRPVFCRGLRKQQQQITDGHIHTYNRHTRVT